MNDRRAGFTLLELMLAMAALTLITAICYGAFHLAVRAMERGEVAVVTAQRLRATTEVFRQIRSALYHLDRNADGDTYPYFRGTATSLTFDTSMQLQGGGGISRVTYQVLDNPTRLVLTESAVPSRTKRHHRRDGQDDEPLAYSRSTVLLEGFQSLHFRYIDVGGDDHASWDPGSDDFEQEGLPLAVRVEIEGVPGVETGRWGQEIPVSVMAMNEAINEGGADALEEAFNNEDENDDEEDVDDDDTGTKRTTPGQPHTTRQGSDDEDDE
jgi:prepilin-type N-terminal cleavage/methylation domain-containing protein